MTARQRRFKRFEAVLKPELVHLLRYAMRLTRDPDNAHELVQETCLRALEKIDQFRGPEKLRPWLFKIMTNLFRDSLRRGKVFKEAEQTGELARIVHLFPSPEEEYLRRELSAKLKEALDSVPEPFRSPIFLVYVEGLTYEEAAYVLDCPVGTIMSRLYRGRGLLRIRLKEYGFLFPGREKEATQRKDREGD